MKEIGAMIRISLLLLIVCGLMYPLAVTGISQAVMPKKANGSLIYNRKGEVIGSELIGRSLLIRAFLTAEYPASAMMPQVPDRQMRHPQIPSY